MNLLNLLCTLIICIVIANGQKIGYATPSVSKSQSGAAVDEVVVESSLYIKKKPQIRRIRDLGSLVPFEKSNFRVKRQHRFRPPGGSQSAANAAAHSNFFGPNGFGASAANAQAQGFRSDAGFGASAANTQTQSLSAGPGGIQGSAAFSGSQEYDLNNGKKINVVFSNGFSAGPGGISKSNSNGVTIS